MSENLCRRADFYDEVIIYIHSIKKVIVSGAKLLKSDWFRGVRLIVNRTITTFCTLRIIFLMKICTAIASFFDKKEYEVFRNVC